MASQSPIDYYTEYDPRYCQRSVSSPMSALSMTFSLSDRSNYTAEPSSPMSPGQFPHQFVNPMVLDYGSQQTNFYNQIENEQISGQVTSTEEPANPKGARSKNAKGADTRFPCLSEGCESDFGRVTDLKRHYNSVHVASRIDCPHKWCGRTGAYGFSRKDHFNEHLREVHKQDIPKASNRRNSSEKRPVSADDATDASYGTYKRSEKSSSSKKGASSKSTRDSHKQTTAGASRGQDPTKKVLKLETANLPAQAERAYQYVQTQDESKDRSSISKRRKQVEHATGYGTASSTVSSQPTIRVSSARR